MKTIKTFAPALLLLVAAMANHDANAQTAQLLPQAQRITDGAIQTDMATYEATQKRIKALNEKGRPVRDYHLAKAQCWLDVSFHEYTRNDRSAFPQEALTESEKLIRGMEAGVNPLSMDTPLVNGADRLRDDLWAQSEALKRHAGFTCAAATIACAEVELVHAGHEHKQQQWRHAKPYVQIAEELVTQGQRLAEACVPPAPAVAPETRAPAVAAEAVAAPAVVPPPAPRPTPAAPPPEAARAHVLFNFDKHTAKEIRANSLEELDALVARLRQAPGLVQGITLIGHADRLNRTGQADYNQRLAAKRVQTVRTLLIERGVAPGLIRTDSKGDSLQVQGCEKLKVEALVRECLLPNRRVEVRLNFKPR